VTDSLLLPPYKLIPDPQECLRLCSLWSMIDTPTANLLNHASGLTKMRDGMKARYQALLNIGFGSVEYSDADREDIRKMDAALRPWFVSHELAVSLSRLDMVMDYAADPDCHIDDLADQLGILLEIAEDELSRKLFLHIPAEDMNLYRHPEMYFSATMKAFPSAVDDIKEACRCFALESFSASVFHCMAIAQQGLYALSVDLKVQPKHPLHLSEWQAIIEGLEKQIVAFRSLPRGEMKDDVLSYYSECAVQFRYFKDAWRNHICHMRDQYTRQSAWVIFTGVQTFMEHLSKRVTELPVPPIEA
jgi:hypothetical protein